MRDTRRDFITVWAGDGSTGGDDIGLVREALSLGVFARDLRGEACC